MPAREPLCHCGVARSDGLRAAAASMASARGAAASSGLGPRTWAIVAAAVTLLGAGGAFVATRPGVFEVVAATGARGRIRGSIGYPALPTVPMVGARRDHGRSAASVPSVAGSSSPPASSAGAPPPLVTDEGWSTAVALLDLPLRAVAADTSLLESRVRSFEEACLQDAAGRSLPSPGRGASGWLAALKTAATRAGITLTVDGAILGCEGLRAGLRAQADAIKARLSEMDALARSRRVSPAQWRRLLAVHDLEVWDSY